MTTGRRRHRLVASVLATALVALATLAPPGPAGGQEPAPPAPDEVRFTGVATKPWVTREGTWTLDLQVEGAPADGEVRAVIRDPLEGRAAYLATLFGVLLDDDQKAAISPVDLATAPDAEGGGKLVSLAVTLLQEGSSGPGWVFLSDGLRPGVYPVEIEVLDGAGEVRGRTIAFLTRVASGEEPGADDPPLLVAPVVPLEAPPSIDPDGEATTPSELVDQGEALVDGFALTTELIDGDLPVTLAPRPESIEALARDDGADEVVQGLHDGAGSRQVLDAPYVDVPLSSWVEAGLEDELTYQRVRGNTVLTSQLGPVDSSTFLTPSGLTPAAASELWDVGVRTLIYRTSTIDRTAPTDTPFTVTDGEGRVLSAVAADNGLATTLTFRGDPVLDQASLAAELALIADEDDDPRGVVVVTPPGWPATPEDLAGVASVLLAPEAPVRATTVNGLVASVPAGPTLALPPAPLEDLGNQPDLLRRARSRLASYASMAGTDDPAVATLDQRLLLSGSMAVSSATRRRYVTSVLSDVDQAFTSIEAPPRQTITLTSSDGTVPLTLRSNMEKPVQILVEMDAGTRIQFRDSARQVVTLTPGINRIPVPVHARAPGETAIDITLRTPDGVEVLDEVRYTVRSTAIPGIGVVLSIGAAAFLLLWWARHWRAARRAKAGET